MQAAVAALDAEHLRQQMLWLGEIEERKQLFRVYADIDPYAGDCMISNLSRLPKMLSVQCRNCLSACRGKRRNICACKLFLLCCKLSMGNGIAEILVSAGVADLGRMLAGIKSLRRALLSTDGLSCAQIATGGRTGHH